MGSFYIDSLSLAFVIGDAPARSEQAEDPIRTHVHALNKELHQRLQQQEEGFQAKEVKLKKKLKTIERRVGKKTERRIIRQM